MPKKALITGITGQDGSYLAELLLSKNYEVHGIVRRSSNFSTQRINHLFNNGGIKDKSFFLHYGDLSDGSVINDLISKIGPDEVYNLGAQSHVKVSFEVPEYSLDINAVGTQRLLNAILKHSPRSRFYQASTSEMFGGIKSEMPENGYDETSRLHPRSPYAASKVCAYWLTINYREAYGMHASNGILFNHESPRRGRTFVTKKITHWFGENFNHLSDGKVIESLKLGNLNASRDWGHAQDYVEAMWLMLQKETPTDYVIAMGETHTVRDFVNLCFKLRGISIRWNGQGESEKGYLDNGTVCIEVDPKYYRPSEVEFLQGNPSKAREMLQWKPRYTFENLVSDMLDSENYRFANSTGEGF